MRRPSKDSVSTVLQFFASPLAFAQERGFAFWVAWGAFLRGAALSMQGQSEEAIVHMQQGLEAAEHTEARVGQSMFLALLAEVYGQAGHPDMGLRIADEALAMARHNGERCYEAETSRIVAELLLTLPTVDEAKAERRLRHLGSLRAAPRVEAYDAQPWPVDQLCLN